MSIGAGEQTVYGRPVMNRPKLRRFPVAEHQRLGELIRKDREGKISETEETEMLGLLKKATRVSETNARELRDLRGGAPTVREKKQ
jgi:hypothetical protein